MLQLIVALQSAEYAITFASASPKNEFTQQLHALGCLTNQIELNNPSFDEFITKLQPDIVMFDRFMTEEQFGWRVIEQCPDALRVLDTEDFHGLRKARELTVKSDSTEWRHYLFNDTTKRELASMLRCDLSLIISEAEIKILRALGIPDFLLHYVPFILHTEINKEIASFERRNDFVTIGNFKHAPNEDAVYYLKETIWPVIRKQLPKAELHIYGAYSQQKHQQLNDSSEGFIVKGKAEDALKTVGNYKVLLAPLRFGAGLKGKLIDAMQSGTPVVMSSIAAEGIYDEMEAELEIEIENFASEAVELYQNEHLWIELQKKGFQCLNERFSKKKHAEELVIKIASLKQHLEKHRNQNALGQVLQHQSLLAHRYLSKWIEEKTKL